jgi:hypothetical protein
MYIDVTALSTTTTVSPTCKIDQMSILTELAEIVLYEENLDTVFLFLVTTVMQIHMEILALTSIIPISMEVEPTITALSLCLKYVQTPMQVPVINPPKMVLIRRIAPEQS